MRRFPAIALLAFLAVAWPFLLKAENQVQYRQESLSDFIPGTPPSTFGYDLTTGTRYFTYILIENNTDTLMADKVALNPTTGEVTADGNVRFESAGQMWLGDHIVYNLKTGVIKSGSFRTGRAPVFVQGQNEEASVKTNHVYTARHVYATTDNIQKPDYYISASRMTIVPGKYVEAWNAILYVKGVPVFYYPYYRRSLGLHANTFNVMPGDESTFGPFLLGTYTWWLNDDVSGKIHLDYREKRGPGVGPDLNLRLGRWGDAQLKYYYLRDHDSGESVNTNVFQNLGNIPENRQRFYLGWQATPATNLNVKALVNYQSDDLVLHDFFQSDYAENPQPNTFVEANKYWDNWSLDAETTPRVNSFFDQVERLPDAQLTGFRQPVLNTPIYYESQSSVGYYERYFAGTNTLFGMTNNTPLDFNAARADTFHQLLLPETFFGWLNVTPRVGARATWYSPEYGAGGTNSETTRYVLNAGGDVSFTASQLWPDAKNSVLDVNGLRHIIVPSLTYAFVPQLNEPANNVPQFDTLYPSLMILPVEFPDYNDIDAINKEDVLRFGIRNTLQTMRNGQLDDLLNWNVMLDWNLRPTGETNSVFLQPQKTFDDLYSDLSFKPRSWITVQSQIRYDINNNHLNMAFHQIAFAPNDRWSVGIGHWYLHNGFVDSGDDVITGTLFYRLNENWGLHAMEYFNAQTGHLQEQSYSIYRDMRSWTAAVAFRVIDNGGGQPVDYGVAFSVSLKALPSFHVGDDTVRPYELLGQ